MDRPPLDFRFAPAQQWTPICRPDDPFKTMSRQDGALLYQFRNDWTFGSWCFRRVVNFRLHTDQPVLSTRQYTETAPAPIVVTETCYPQATLVTRTVGHLDEQGRRFDLVEWEATASDLLPETTTAFVVEIAEFGGYVAPAELADPAFYGEVFSTEPGLAGRVMHRYDPAVADLYLAPDVVVAPAGEQRRAEYLAAQGEPVLISAPLPLRMCPAQGGDPNSALRSDFAVLAPGTSIRGHLVLPLEPDRLAAAEAEGIDAAWAERAWHSERKFWANARYRRRRIEVPDPTLDRMITVASRMLFQARDVRDGQPEFQVGCAFFRGVWIVDSYFILEAAQYLGWPEEAAAGVDVVLRRRQPDGSIAQIPAHKKETAIALAILVRQAELSGDWDRLQGNWEVVRAATRHIHEQLESMRSVAPDHPAYGLTPLSFGDGGIGGLRHDYTTVYWTLVGLAAAASAAERLGHTEDAAATRADYDQLLDGFRRSAETNRRISPDGVRYLPSVLPGSGEHNWVANTTDAPPPWHTIQPETATWALCQAIYPGEVFGADDEVTTDLLALFDARDNEQGLPATTGFLTHQAVWTYAGSFAAHAFLAAGYPDKAIEYLYAYANHASPIGLWREEQSLTASRLDQLSGDMPTNWAGSELVRLIRNTVVLERRSGLDIFAGVPTFWLRPGDRITVEATPTRYGPVSVTAAVSADGVVEVAVRRDQTWPVQPERMTMRIPTRTPDAVPEVRVSGELVPTRTERCGQVIDLPLGAGPVTVRFSIA
jgi:hypothetical protein